MVEYILAYELKFNILIKLLFNRKTVKLEQGKNILTLRKLLSEKDYNNILNKRDINRYAL